MIHITYAFPTTMFLVSGMGYLMLLAAFFTPKLRSVRGLVGVALALFAIGNIVGWYLNGARIPLAYTAKAIEAALLAALAAYVVVARRRAAVPVRLAPRTGR